MKKSYILKKVILFVFFTSLYGQIQALDITVPVGGNIQTAINSVASSGGGTVTLSAGTHVITTPVRMKSNVTLQGEENWSSLLKTTINMKMIIANAEGLVNLTIQNLAIEGTNALNGGGIEIIAGDDVEHNNVHILNVHCYNTGWGVHVKGTYNLLVKDCLFEKNGTVGKEGYAHNMYLRRVYGAEVRDSKFMNSTSANGINISYSTNITVYNCEMSGNYFRGVRAANTDGYLVHDCIVKNNGNVGILANSEGVPTTNIDIKRNCVSGNVLEGIKGVNGVTGVVEDNNSFGNEEDYDFPSSVSLYGNTSNSNETCIYATDPQIKVTEINGDGFVTLDWVIENATLTQQNIYRDTDPDMTGSLLIAENVDVSTFTYTDSSVTNGVIYWYWVKGNDELNGEIISGAVNSTPNGDGSAVTVTAVSKDGAVSLYWNIKSIDMTKVSLFRDTDDNASGRKFLTNDLDGATSYTDSSVTNGVEYWYWVKVTDREGKNHQNDPGTYALPNPILGVVDILLSDNETQITFYPNPVLNQINIDAGKDNFSLYSIINPKGEVVAEGSISRVQSIKMIDVSMLARGVYFVSLTGSYKNKSFKFIKE